MGLNCHGIVSGKTELHHIVKNCYCYQHLNNTVIFTGMILCDNSVVKSQSTFEVCLT